MVCISDFSHISSQYTKNLCLKGLLFIYGIVGKKQSTRLPDGHFSILKLFVASAKFSWKKNIGPQKMEQNCVITCDENSIRVMERTFVAP